MFTAITLIISVVHADVGVAHRMFQLAPVRASGRTERSPSQSRAVLLVHGLRFAASGTEVTDALPSDWQEPDSRVVRMLAPQADVFAFAYGQNDAAHRLAPALQEHVRELRNLGYSDIVLVGHSAGGILVRHFVEDYPDSGVTKVIQVACPNSGCPSASDLEGDKRQRRFIESLTKAGRAAVLEQRRTVRIPDRVQFVCVVARTGKLKSDMAVPVRCQWPADLQSQGIPCVELGGTTHLTAMTEQPTAQLLADVLRRDFRRWTAEEVSTARGRLFP